MPGDGAEDGCSGFVGWREEVDGEAVVEEADGVVLLCFVGEGALDFESGGVASGVVDAVGVVAAFASGAEVTVGVFIEGSSPVEELLEVGWALGADELDGCGVAHACAGGEGVFDVGVDGVCGVGWEDGGDASLCP